MGTVPAARVPHNQLLPSLVAPLTTLDLIELIDAFSLFIDGGDQQLSHQPP